jgi:hypothetical protein
MSPALTVPCLRAKAFGAVVDCGPLVARPVSRGHGIHQPNNLFLEYAPASRRQPALVGGGSGAGDGVSFLCAIPNS